MSNNSSKRPTQVNLMIRVVVAVYLIYIAHSLISGLNEADNPKLIIGFAIAFVFAGVLIIAFSIKAFINKDYQDFMTMNLDDSDDESNDVVDAETVVEKDIDEQTVDVDSKE